MGNWASFIYRPTYAAQGIAEYTLFDTGLVCADSELLLVQTHRQATSNVHGLTFTGEGAGKGLDADKVDGYDFDAFASSAHTHSGTEITSIVASATCAVNALSASTATNSLNANDSNLLDGLDSLAFAASAHASQHLSGGADSIKLDDLASADDNTDLNVTSGAHGLIPKFPGNITTFFRGDGTYVAPTSIGGAKRVIIPAGAFESRATPTSAWMAFAQTEGTNFDYGQINAPSGNDTKAFTPSITLGSWNQTAMTGTIGWKTSTTSASPAGVVFTIYGVGVSGGQIFDSALTEISSAAVSAGTTANALNLSPFIFTPSVMLSGYDSVWEIMRKSRTASGAVGDTLLNTASIMFFTLEWTEI